MVRASGVFAVKVRKGVIKVILIGFNPVFQINARVLPLAWSHARAGAGLPISCGCRRGVIHQGLLNDWGSMLCGKRKSVVPALPAVASGNYFPRGFKPV